MEAIKGCIFDRGKQKMGNKNVHSYLVGFILVTDEELTDLDESGETIVMGVSQLNQDIADKLQGLTKYKFPFRPGDLSSALIHLSDYDPGELEETNGKSN